MTLRRLASLAGALTVAAIAALASYSHMRGLALRYGQPEVIADLLPVSVDGMMVVATVALGDGRRYRWSAWVAFWTGVGASVTANVLAAEPSTIARSISAWPAVAFLLVVEVITRGGRHHGPDRVSSENDDPRGEGMPVPGEGGRSEPPAAPARRTKVAKPNRRTTAETWDLAAELRAKFPTITQAELARKLGISATRLRQVERAKRAAEAAEPVNSADQAELSEVRT
jgi:hypothetical protein